MGLYLIVGPLLAIMGLGLLMNQGRMMKMMTEMMESKGMLFIMGMINLVLGLVIIHAIDPSGWETWVLVVIGWGALVKGIMINLFPKMIKKQALLMMKKYSGLMQGALFIMTLFGLWMTWAAYMG